MKTLIIILCSVLLLLSHTGNTQSIDQIKKSSKYLWGEGKGTTQRKAEADALSVISANISLHVESNVKYQLNEGESEGKFNLKDSFESVIKTYASATLNNVRKIIISPEPDAHVFMYMRRDEVSKVFNQRREQIMEFVSSGLEFREKRQVSEALRSLYWGLVLLRTHPDKNKLKYNHNGKEKLLSIWIPDLLRSIFNSLTFSVQSQENNEMGYAVYLKILYDNQPVSVIDYSYYTGKGWSNNYNVKAGIGYVEFIDKSIDELSDFQLRVEYMYDNQSHINPEVSQFFNSMKNLETEKGLSFFPTFREAYFTIKLDNVIHNKEESQAEKEQSSSSNKKDIKAMSTHVDEVSNMVAKKNVFVESKNTFDELDPKNFLPIIDALKININKKNYEYFAFLFYSRRVRYF